MSLQKIHFAVLFICLLLYVVAGNPSSQTSQTKTFLENQLHQNDKQNENNLSQQLIQKCFDIFSNCEDCQITDSDKIQCIQCIDGYELDMKGEECVKSYYTLPQCTCGSGKPCGGGCGCQTGSCTTRTVSGHKLTGKCRTYPCPTGCTSCNNCNGCCIQCTTGYSLSGCGCILCNKDPLCISYQQGQICKCASCKNGYELATNQSQCTCSGNICNQAQICYKFNCVNCSNVIAGCANCSTVTGVNATCFSCLYGLTVQNGTQCLCKSQTCTPAQICYSNTCTNCSQLDPHCTSCFTADGKQAVCKTCINGLQPSNNSQALCLCGGLYQCASEQVCYNNQCKTCSQIVRDCDQCISTGINLLCLQCRPGLKLIAQKCYCDNVPCLGSQEACLNNTCQNCNKAITNCIECLTDNRTQSGAVCTTCVRSFTLEDGNCKCQGSVCAQGEICYILGCTKCGDIVRNCRSCQIDEYQQFKCQSCVGEYLLKNNVCVCGIIEDRECPLDQICSQGKCQTCEKAIPYCVSCIPTNGASVQCIRCQDGFILENGVCKITIE